MKEGYILIMIRIFIKLLFISPILLITACKKDFSPKANLISGYAINCIVGIKDSTMPGNFSSPPECILKAYLSRIYDIEGYKPDSSESKNFVPAADIRIKYYAQSYKLSDTSISVIMEHDTAGKLILKRIYTPVKNYQKSGPRVEGGEPFELIARMPDGSMLTSKIELPHFINFSMNRTFNQGITTTGLEWKFGTVLEFSWMDYYRSDHLYLPKFVINGQVISQNKDISIEVPCKYVKQGEKYAAIYPGAVRNYKIGFDYAAIDSAMKNISAGYEDKSDIRITNCMISAYVLERNLAAFYTSTSGNMDSYSIRLDLNVFSNIAGGYGIFGSYYYTNQYYLVHKSYCQSFGYRSIYGD